MSKLLRLIREQRQQSSETVYFHCWGRTGDNPGYAPSLDLLQQRNEAYEDFLDRAAAKALQSGTHFVHVNFMRTHDEHAARLRPR